MYSVPRPASEKQVNYIRALSEQVGRLLEEGRELAAEIDEVADSSLDKRTASDLIDHLIQVVTFLKEGNGELPPGTSSQGAELTSRLKDVARQQQDDVVERRREADAAREAFYEREVEILGGTNREPPGTLVAHIRVWKKYPNRKARRYYVDVEYGWRWECTHPDHGQKKDGSSRVIGGGSIYGGHAASIESAHKHAMKYHPDMLNSRGPRRSTT